MTDKAAAQHDGESSQAVFLEPQGPRIPCYRWQPDTPARAVVQIIHGLGEHAPRYERFAKACNASGIAVVAHNQRGHGEFARPEDLGHIADFDGWSCLIDDARKVQDDIRRRFGDIPLVLLGHSMGSYIAQSFVMRHPQCDIAALILSASTLPRSLELWLGRLVAAVERWRIGPRGRSALLDKLGFGNFNKPFEPARTDHDWLSRDEHEVDKYIADPLCGGPYTCRLWLDLIGGLREISARRAIARVPHKLPILITGGEADPVGGVKGLTALANAYRKAGHGKLTLTIYPGGRHEMLNETNREAVTADILRWIDRTLQ